MTGSDREPSGIHLSIVGHEGVQKDESLLCLENDQATGSRVCVVKQHIDTDTEGLILFME